MIFTPALGHTRPIPQLYPPAPLDPALDLNFAARGSLGPLVTFTRGSAATFIDAAGLVATAATNAPRFTHDPVTRAPLGLLMEEARTNLLLNSAALATQAATVAATAYTLSFSGTGTITLSGASTAGPLVCIGVGPANRVALTFTPAAGTLTLTVAGSVVNAQLEAGAFATSYIATAGAAATRAADVATITGANFTQWHVDGPGSFSVDYRVLGAASTFYALAALGPASNRIVVAYRGNIGTPEAQIFRANVNQFGLTLPTRAVLPPARFRQAFAWSSGSSVLAEGGFIGAVNTTTYVGAAQDSLSIGGGGAFVFARLRYYRRRLADATLQALSA